MDVNPVSAVIFDKDGTLFDLQTTWGTWTGMVIDHLADGNGDLASQMVSALDYDAEARQLKPGSLVIAGTPAEISDVLADILDQPAGQIFDTINDLAARAPQARVPGIEAALQDLIAMGLKLAVMTNDAESPALANLEAGGIAACFDLIIGSDSGYGAKPAPDPLLTIAGDLGVDVSETLMVGDSLHDLQAGRAAGMRTVGVLTGLAETNMLAPFADVVLPSASHLPDWLKKNAPA